MRSDQRKAYDTAMASLAEQYMLAWDRADEEKRLTGCVSDEAERLLINLEKEMDKLEAAF